MSHYGWIIGLVGLIVAGVLVVRERWL